MEVGIISPIRFLKRYCKTGVQYCVPSLLVNEREYRDFYMDRKDKVILDCRKLGWKREPEDLDIIDKALSIITPTYIVVPSHMFDTKKTLSEIRVFMDEYREYYSMCHICIEGTCKEEVSELVYQTQGIKKAIPSHMYSVTKSIDNLEASIYVDNHLSLYEVDSKEGILVTSLPVRLGLQGRLMNDYRPSPPPLDFYVKEDLYPKVIERNIKDTVDWYKWWVKK